jgi:hypothetical protein
LSPAVEGALRVGRQFVVVDDGERGADVADQVVDLGGQGGELLGGLGHDFLQVVDAVGQAVQRQGQLGGTEHLAQPSANGRHAGLRQVR